MYPCDMQPEVRAIRALLDQAVAGLDPHVADQRPRQDRWSIGEIVEHLARTYMGTAKGFDLCAADGRPRASSLSWHGRGRKFILLTLGHFPRGVESPAPVKPKDWGFALALERAHGGLDALDTAAAAAAARFGDVALILDHPVLGAFSVRDWCRFHIVHTRHHTRQIAAQRRVTKLP